MVAVVKGNRREIPGNLPPLLWWEKIEEYRTDPRTRSLRFFDPRMEVLSPDELARVRAKALIWWEVTDELPNDISTWWEIRMARRRGDLPSVERQFGAIISEDGILHCGYCDARWSFDQDGNYGITICKLCGSKWDVITDLQLESMGVMYG
jgi:hypothetical protein